MSVSEVNARNFHHGELCLVCCLNACGYEVYEVVTDITLGMMSNDIVEGAFCMGSLSMAKLLDSRKRTIAMLEERVDSLKAVPEYKGSVVLQGVVRVAEQRLERVRAEAKELEAMIKADARQTVLPGVKPSRA